LVGRQFSEEFFPKTSENSWNSGGSSFEAEKDSSSLADLIWGIEMLGDFQLMPGLALCSQGMLRISFQSPRGRQYKVAEKFQF
jgi:hypothetical protein